MEVLIRNVDSLFEESLPIRPAEPVPAPINTHGLRGSRTSVASPRFEEVESTPQTPQSTTTIMSSSSPTCSPVTPPYFSAGSSGSHMSMQAPWLLELANFSALGLYAGDQSGAQQVRVPAGVERNSVVLHERGLNGSQVFLPSHLTASSEQQERKRQLEESLAYLYP
jgi:hypothetical protein